MNANYRTLVLVFFLLTEVCLAQKVTSITAEQVGQTIQVSYNLETQSPCTISLFYSTDNGASWQGPLKKVSGDIGEKVTSGSKKITWDVLNELEQLKFSSVVFKVDAINYVEEMAKFPGGESEMYKFIGRNIRYPQMAVDAGITGKVFVSFVVDENGYVTDVKVLRGIGGGCDEEAIRTIKAMPKWIPGTQNGKPVCVSLNLPISFKLNGGGPSISDYKIDYKTQNIPSGFFEEKFKESNIVIIRTIINTASNQVYYLKVVYNNGSEEYYRGVANSQTLVKITSSVYKNEVNKFRKVLSNKRTL